MPYMTVASLEMSDEPYFFFFDGILNIPSDRIPSAKWIYQLMLLSTVLTIQTVPYNAIINAHENMRYLSIIGVFQTLMKLVIALIVAVSYTHLTLPTKA